MNSQPSSSGSLTNPDKALTTLRMIWAALLLGQIIFFCIIVFGVWPGRAPTGDRRAATMLFYASIALLVLQVPIGWMMRASMYRSGQQRAGTDAVPPAAYVTGNIVFLAMLESASLIGLVATMLNGAPWPPLIVPIVSGIIQALSFPTGAAMRS